MRNPDKEGAMRALMPGTTAFIDELREIFGEAGMRQSIRAGLARGTMWAVEGPNGWSYEGNQVVGHPFCDWPRGVKVADMIIDPPNVKGARKRGEP